MPNLLNAAEVKDRVKTDLADDVIEKIISEEQAEIERRHGPTTGSVTEVIDTECHANIFLPRRINTVVSVKEGTDVADLTTLTSEQFRAVPDEGIIVRTELGMPAAFSSIVEVVYTPQDDTQERKRILMELCRLSLERQAMVSEGVGQGDYVYKSPNWEAEREKLIAKLSHFLPL